MSGCVCLFLCILVRTSSGLSDEHLLKSRSRCCNYILFEKIQVDAIFFAFTFSGIRLTNLVVAGQYKVDGRDDSELFPNAV